MLAMVGQILIGLFFAVMGGYNFKNRSHLLESLRGRNLRVPEWAVMAALALEVLGGAMVIFNYAAKLGAIYLIAFTVVASFLLHPFWTVKGKEMWKHLLIIASNAAIIGGLFLILGMHR
jgi:uncharacterized membrane protein YphA (DoxX/SURF4 family)